LELASFLDIKVSRVYIAARLPEASSVERILSEHDIDYAVVVEPYLQPLCVLFSLGLYAGAAFFVSTTQASVSRSVLRSAGFNAGIQDDESD